MKWRGALLLGIVGALIAATLFIHRIPQSEAYHNLADQRMLLGVPNCLNVVSNVLFLFVGALGILQILLGGHGGTISFIDSRERCPWLIFFVAVASTAFGSAYYHLSPNDHTLVWDRLPMAIGFMALLAAVISERINVAVGLWLLGPLTIVCGAGSVFWWGITQSRGNDDLRPYALVQFGSLVVLLLILALYPKRYTRGLDFILSFVIYGIAKVFEAADRPVYALGHIVSGHTLKHIAAAVCAYWLLRMLQMRKLANRFREAESEPA
ncbi:MAG: alkaline phytoceramidase [Candidatus Acidiferrales bacterium]